MTIPRSERASGLLHAALVVATIAAVAATIAIGASARAWIGTSFPGFFVLANRVIPSVGLTNWSGTRDGAVYQRTIVAMNGTPVTSAREIYRRVAAEPPGRVFAYTLRRGSTTETVELASHRFSATDYSAIFGAYLLNGLCYLLLAVLAAWLVGDTDLGRALLFLGGVAGIFALSAVGLYGPEPDIRVHALAEAFFPATVVYLTMTFPRSRGWLTTTVTAAGWWLSLALVVPYQLLLAQPGAYSILHGACEAYLGVAGIGLVVMLIVERGRAGDAATPLLRAALAGALLGLGVPAVVVTLSSLSGGGLPVNVSATSAFLFPACFAYGLLRQRLARHAQHALAPSLG